MSKALSIFERITVESLEGGAQSLVSLSNDTGIKINVLTNVINELLLKKMIVVHDNIFALNKAELSHWSNDDSCLKSIKRELKGLFELVVSSYKKSENKYHIRLQKIYMTKDEERIYNNHLVEFDQFITNIGRNRSNDKLKIETKNKKVVYWGHVEYSNLINEALA